MFLLGGCNYTLATSISPSYSCFSWGTSNVSSHQECFPLTLSPLIENSERRDHEMLRFTALQYTGDTLWNISASTLKPAGSQPSFGLSEVEALMKHLGRCTHKIMNKERTLLREGTLRKCQDAVLLLTRRVCLLLCVYLVITHFYRPS